MDEGDEISCVGNCPELSKKATKSARNMSCPELLDKINELAFRDKIGGGAKGLSQRFRDYKGDDATHGPEIQKQQRSIRSYMQEYISKGCGDPPPGVKELSERPLPIVQPVPSKQTQENLETAGRAGGVIVGGYLLYRAIRMLPSLFPLLWPTIPANLAVP